MSLLFDSVVTTTSHIRRVVIEKIARIKARILDWQPAGSPSDAHHDDRGDPVLTSTPLSGAKR